MADLLSIAGNSVKTNQAALAVVGNNIANANTEGYVRQELDVRENLPTQSGTAVLGTGALATGVKRAYDSLVEASLRSSFSELRSLSPVIDYTNRVVDVLGDESASLTSALDNFFSSFRDLGLDASSELRRSSVISESKNLVSRFHEISTQLRSIDSDTLNALEYKVSELNSLTEQLGLVNRKLGRQASLQKQPADLLNTRDLLLQNISGLIKIRVNEASNGEVSVSVGDQSTSLALVSKANNVQVALAKNNSISPTGVSLILDPYGNQQNLSTITGGEIGGLLSFRDTTLKHATEEINSLAVVTTNEVNNMLSKGMDLYGNSGSSLFEIKPEITVNTAFVRSNISITTVTESTDSANDHELEMMFDQPNQRWLVTDLKTNNIFSTHSINNFSINGINIAINGTPVDGDIFTVKTSDAQASNIAVAITDGKKLAAGDLFGLTLGRDNTGGAKASVSATLGSSIAGSTMQEYLVNNPHASSAQSFTASYLSSSFAIPSGTTDLALSSVLDEVNAAELQVFTREGVHLFGSDNLSDSQVEAMLSTQNGFESSATYNKQYLNETGAYLDKSWSLGVFGESSVGLSEDGHQYVEIEASIEGQSIPLSQNSTAQEQTLIEANALSLNGTPLTALTLGSGETLSSDAVVTWLNNNINQDSLSLNASAKTKLILSADQIDFTSTDLSLNGTDLNITSSLEDLSSLANKINDYTATTGVTASIDPLGNLTLENVDGVAGKTASSTISLGAAEGILKVAGDVRAGIKIEAVRVDGDFSNQTVSLERTSTSNPGDLNILGFSETLSIPGTLDEDLVIFSTGSAGQELNLYATYSNSEAELLNQRERVTNILFTSESAYQIIDEATGTVLGERNWSVGSSINYGSFSITIDGQPKTGDIFSIDGNQTGVGSNENALRIADLESLDIAGDGSTLKESYLSILTDAGSSARRAAVAEDALDVVYQQVTQTKDAKAGVNLDEEAAELLRFQQAYQASAKVMQIAGQLFDSILRI